jgi:hypothetical protein
LGLLDGDKNQVKIEAPHLNNKIKLINTKNKKATFATNELELKNSFAPLPEPLCSNCPKVFELYDLIPWKNP